MGIRYSACIICDICGTTLPVINNDIKDPSKDTIVSKARASGWHFRYSTGGIAFCPGCAAERIVKRSKT